MRSEPVRQNPSTSSSSRPYVRYVREVIEAWVADKNGDKLEEYQTHHTAAEGDEPSITTTYIEAVPSTTFSVRLRQIKPAKLTHDWQAVGWVDMRELSTTAWQKHSTAHSFSKFYYEDEGKIKEGELTFSLLPSRLELMDEEDEETTDKRGCICIELRAGRWVPEEIQDEAPKVQERTLGPVNEILKKFPTEVTAHAGEDFIPEAKLYYVFKPTRPGTIFHRFLFRFRHRLVLQQMHLIPLDDTSAEVDDPSDMSEETELRRLQTSLRKAIRTQHLLLRLAADGRPEGRSVETAIDVDADIGNTEQTAIVIE